MVKSWQWSLFTLPEWCYGDELSLYTFGTISGPVPSHYPIHAKYYHHPPRYSARSHLFRYKWSIDRTRSHTISVHSGPVLRPCGTHVTNHVTPRYKRRARWRKDIQYLSLEIRERLWAILGNFGSMITSEVIDRDQGNQRSLRLRNRVRST